jgi:glycosyltransferase involved in cell wall biosynthesis
VFATASDTDVVPARVRLNARDRLFYRWGLTHADRVVAQHPGQRDLLLEHSGVESRVIGMGARYPERVPAPAHPPTVLWLGNYRAVKRPGIFLEIARGNPGTRFRMVGGPVPTEAELYDEVRERAKGLANVEVLGPVSDVSPHLESAWVLLNTSEVEGFPTSFLEAWGHGVPTLSFFDPGGVIREHRPGLLAETPEEMSVILRRLLASVELRQEAGRRARAYVEREHGPDVVAGRFEEEFRAAAGRHGRP